MPDDPTPPTATSAPELPDTPATPPPARSKGRLVDPDVLHLDPRLLDSPLAAPWRRVAAMAVDLTLVGALSLLAGPVLGLLTGVTLAALGSRRVSTSRFWLGFRWVLVGLGAGVVLLSAFLLVGRPLVRTAAFNLGRAEAAPSLDAVVVPPNAGSSELRRAVRQLQEQVDLLKADNARLRGAGTGGSLVNVTADASRLLGVTFGWAGVYFTLFPAWLAGRTPGKVLLRIRIVRLDGRPITAMDAFTRNGGYAAGVATGMAGFLRVLWDPNRQAIQDKIAGTVVLSTRAR